jgi:hypothetical protein
MWPYWIMFLLPAMLAAQEASRSANNPSLLPAMQVRVTPAWWWVLVVFTLLIGFRHEVGGDWGNYLRNFDDAIYVRQYSEWWWNDPGYRLLEWISIEFGWGIYGVNLMSAAIFSYGLVVFCRHLPRPWLALAVAVPYLVIILGMGYSRQGIALGAAMVGLVVLGQGNVRKFVFWVVVGALFHKSAVLLLPIAALAASRNRWLTAVWVAVVAVVAYVLLLEDSIDYFTTGYLDAEYQSQGALIRLIMNVLPAFILLFKRKRFSITMPQERLWFWLAIGVLALLVLYYVTASSTAVDRVGLYLLPLQLMVFAHLPEVMGHKSGKGNLYWVLGVLFYYAAVEFVWLNFATHSVYWLPYRFLPFEMIFN